MKLQHLNVAVEMGPMQQSITTQHANCSIFAQPDCQLIPTTITQQKKTNKKVVILNYKQVAWQWTKKEEEHRGYKQHQIMCVCLAS